ncbi:MAG: class I tRNA ligase family protein, partial [Actinomycetales bacterium]|nr:class I tRNA ligase family protein [Actinomycetales bacterium]
EAKRSTASTDVLDRYLLAKTGVLITDVAAALDKFDTFQAAALLRDFGDVLTNWYVRRSRDRFWEGNAEAFDTLYTVLETLARVAAPMLPLVAEEIWQGLTAGRSVHLESWPDAAEFPIDLGLVAAMDQVRAVASTANALRKAAQLRVRLPLAKLSVVAPNAKSLEPFASIIADELNVKSIELVELTEDSGAKFGVVKRLTVNARAAGPRLGKGVQAIIVAAKDGFWTEENGVVSVNGTALVEGEYSLELVAAASEDNSNLVGILADGGFVLLDGQVTPELAAEGLARDLIRAVQAARKDAGLDVSDRIQLIVTASAEVVAAAETHAELVKSETLTVDFELVVGEVAEATATVGEDLPVLISVSKS